MPIVILGAPAAARVPLASAADGTILQAGTFIPASGAQAYVYQHGGVTQASVYEDETSTTTLTQPLTADANGELPGWVLAEQDLDIAATFQGHSATGVVVALRASQIVAGVDWEIIREAPLNVTYTEYGAACDGVTHDDVAIAAAVAALPSRGGEILIPGPMALAEQLDLNGTTSITFIGLGGITAGAQPPSSINFTQSGSTSALSIQNAYGLTFRDLGILSVNSAFTGTLVDASWTGTGGDGGYLSIENALVAAGGNCARLLDLHQTQEGSFTNVNFLGGTCSVRGKAGGSNDFSTAHAFIECAFRNSVSACVQNPGEGWTFVNPTGEPLSGGDAGFASFGYAWKGFSLHGGWFGDTATGHWLMFATAGGGASIRGAYFGGSAAPILISAAQTGMAVHGNAFDDCAYAISVAASLACSDFDIAANDMSGCLTGGILIGASTTFARSLIVDGKAGTADMYGVTVH